MKKMLTGLTLASIISILLILLIGVAARRDGFFTRFQNEAEVETYILQNLALTSSTWAEVEIFMEDKLSLGEDCYTHTIRHPNRTQARLNRPVEDYDTTFIICEVYLEPTWMFSLNKGYYVIQFYFIDDVLEQVVIYRFGRGL